MKFILPFLYRTVIRMKKKITLFLSIMMLFFLGSCQKKDIPSNKNYQKESKSNAVIKTNIPTVFIHGYSGTERTMKNMVREFEKDNFGKEELLLTVDETGSVSSQNMTKKSFKKNNPMVQLVFLDNKSHQWNQAEWIRAALAFLKKEYQVNDVNLVGFSMGGISSFLYLETYSKEKTQPQVRKLATIGAPFNEFIETENQELENILKEGPKPISEQLINYENLADNLPRETKFLLVGGQLSESNKSDGTVPISSSLGVYHLLDKKQYDVKNEVIFGVNASHSSLRKNEDVDRFLSEFLWQV